MSRVKRIRRKLGILYWKCHSKVKTWWYFQKKNWRRFADWIRGWFSPSLVQMTELSQIQCLVVCAHPDDETLYFSSVLRKENAFVICMSGKGSRCRTAEFYEALKRQGVHGVLLNMPDVPNMAWVWKLFASRALHMLTRHCAQVKIVYTHNCSGESHHPHHYATSHAVDKNFTNCKIYKTAAELPDNHRGRLSDEDLEMKLSVLRESYRSQIKMLEGWYPWWTDYLENEFFEDASNV